MTYLNFNKSYWSRGYEADNVESFVFRVYGRVFKAQLNITGESNEKLLDFGCGSGATAGFFLSKGFDVYGVDISDKDIGNCKQKYPDIADHFLTTEPQPVVNQNYFSTSFDVVTAIQSLYYLSHSDFNICIKNLYNSLKPGGIIYATMIGTKASRFYNYSNPVGDGLRKVEFNNNDRIKLNDYYINFTNDFDDLENRFSLFDKIHLGYYDQCYREDEGSSFHYTFIGRKKV